MRIGRSRVAICAGLSALALVVSGCGGDDHPNEPRPPTQITLSAAVSDEEVSLSPDGISRRAGVAEEGDLVGAGPALITATNQSSEEVTLTITGPVEGATEPMPANGGTAQIKLELREGNYEVGAINSNISPAPLRVGPERPSSQDDLLLP